jgi:hypothetical protein
MYNIRYGLNYLRHRLGANNRHGIHSPFVYKLIDTVIYDYRDQKVYREIENTLQKQHPDKRVIKAMPLKVYKLLYRFAVYFRPKRIRIANDKDYIMEFVIRQAALESQSINLTGLPDADGADLNLADALEQDATSYLEKLMPAIHDDTVVIFTNIHRTQNTEYAWAQMRVDNRVRVTIDLFYIGLVFFKPGMSKEDFKVRY